MTREEKAILLYNTLKELEIQKNKEGYSLLAGADEAGRGPLAGPVVAACVILPRDCRILGINDSKKISEKKRENLYDEICACALAWAVGVVDAQTIDRINILNAARLAFKQAIEGLAVTPDFLFTDAIDKLDIFLPYMPVIKGDAKVYSIAAASIIAKVTRDRMMRELDVLYPQYGFAQHKGYGTKKHRDAILQYGALPCHRRSFLKNMPESIYEK